MRTCTWKDCRVPALFQQVAMDGVVWADLCNTHDRIMQETKKPGVDAKTLLRNWVLAQGGATLASKRF